MRFKLDENLPRAARRVLEAQSWDVHEEKLAGAIDAEIRATVACLKGAVRLLATEEIVGTLWLVEPERIRLRRWPGGGN